MLSPSRRRSEGEGGGEGGEKAGGGQEGGREGGPRDPLVGTTAHVPYGGRVEVGTVTGVHISRAGGVVVVKYPNYPKLYQVERHVIFSTAEAAEAHLQKVRMGKTLTTNSPATKPSNRMGGRGQSKIDALSARCVP